MVIIFPITLSSKERLVKGRSAGGANLEVLAGIGAPFLDVAVRCVVFCVNSRCGEEFVGVCFTLRCGVRVCKFP
ncbi:hypothetical protein E2C01_037964 [Portunus trituberculatus]|uniref:Uncharacterized protein n=1 Tax=Portunus trituberculatus TaxID=210409 RepID=A0A5B7FCW6_PORTR|nr:hypothetical protein [Portunus trituberculatus]